MVACKPSPTVPAKGDWSSRWQMRALEGWAHRRLMAVLRAKLQQRRLIVPRAPRDLRVGTGPVAAVAAVEVAIGVAEVDRGETAETVIAPAITSRTS